MRTNLSFSKVTLRRCRAFATPPGVRVAGDRWTWGRRDDDLAVTNVQIRPREAVDSSCLSHSTPTRASSLKAVGSLSSPPHRAASCLRSGSGGLFLGWWPRRVSPELAFLPPGFQFPQLALASGGAAELREEDTNPCSSGGGGFSVRASRFPSLSSPLSALSRKQSSWNANPAEYSPPRARPAPLYTVKTRLLVVVCKACGTWIPLPPWSIPPFCQIGLCFQPLKITQNSPWKPCFRRTQAWWCTVPPAWNFFPSLVHLVTI